MSVYNKKMRHIVSLRLGLIVSVSFMLAIFALTAMNVTFISREWFFRLKPRTFIYIFFLLPRMERRKCGHLVFRFLIVVRHAGCWRLSCLACTVNLESGG